MGKDILVPIRTPWTTMIFCGTKPFEFRNKVGREVGPGSKLYIYESKADYGAGMVMGYATINEILPIPTGAVGPPRFLLRAWAEQYKRKLLPLLNKLGDYELPNYKKGTVLRYLGRPDLLEEVMRTNQWIIMLDEGDNPIDDCERWLKEIGLVNDSGDYCYKYAFRLGDVQEYAVPLPLSTFGLTRAPQSWCYTDGPA